MDNCKNGTRWAEISFNDIALRMNMQHAGMGWDG
jgi:hypothetical protein